MRGSEYKVPYANIYRGLAIMGTQGFSALPKYCAYFMGAFFFGSVALNALRDAVGLRWPRAATLISVPMVRAVRGCVAAAACLQGAMSLL